MAKKTIKTKAWNVFSKYIRLRDTSKLGCECYTCGKFNDWKKMHAGHFQPGRHNVFMFDDRQVHGQCAGCNTFKRGNWPAYYERMVKEYGQEEVNKMIADRKKTVQMKEYQYEEIYKKYKAKLKQWIVD